MKKTIYLLAATLLFTLTAFTARAGTASADPPTKGSISAMTLEQKKVRLAGIRQRIDEIKAMDKSQLARPQRKALRAELRGLRKESADMVGVLYIGAGLLVFIALLLIIFLR